MDEKEFWENFNKKQKEKRDELEPKRKTFAMKKLLELNYDLEWDDFNRCFNVKGKYNGKFYPYTGWYSFKKIGSDRGLSKLLRKLRD